VADPVAAIENFLTTDPAIPDGRADQPIDNEAILISPAYRDRLGTQRSGAHPQSLLRCTPTCDHLDGDR
jgi:hypothetical protein